MTTTDATSTTDTVTPELVVLLDDDGQSVGTADKAGVHHADTPLHLAFSCYVFDEAGRFLITQRASHKPTFGGVWTNSACGHPAPGEPIEDAVRRRVGQELGLTLDDLRLVLPGFRYRAVMDNGVTENEMCPVFVATTRDAVRLDPEEVDDHEWVDWPEFRAEVLDGTRDVSSWCVEQVTALPEDPRAARAADPTELPSAAR
jgi:isopentenyl-diphosphate delta-isomerase